MRRTLAGLVLTGALLVAAAASGVAAATVQPTRGAPPAGSIQFDVHYGSQGFKIGEARHDWRIAGGRYEMRLNLEAKGLAGLFGLHYEQRSVGTVDAKGMRPERFSVDQRGRKLESAEFDWQAGREVEVESIWGEPLRRAKAVGATTPRMALLYALLRQLTSRGPAA